MNSEPEQTRIEPKVGEVWYYNDGSKIKYTVHSLPKIKQGADWTEGVEYCSEVGACYVRTVGNFLANFRRVEQ